MRARSSATPSQPRPHRGSARERGSAVIELVLALPFLVFVLMAALGIGWALSTKQHAVVAARYAADAAEIASSSSSQAPLPPSVRISGAVSKGTEEWETSQVDPPGNASDVAKAELDNAGGFNDSVIADACVGIIDVIGVGGVRGVEARSQPKKGIFAQVKGSSMPFAKARYYQTAGTWTCREGADYAGFVKGEAEDAFGSLVWPLTEIPSALPDNLSCCADGW